MFLLLLPLKKVYIDPYLLNLISLVTNYGYLPHMFVTFTWLENLLPGLSK